MTNFLSGLGRACITWPICGGFWYGLALLCGWA